MAAPWSPKDGYGPMILALLEHAALRVGVVARPPDASMGPLRGGGGTLLWSGGVTPGDVSATSRYTQTLGEHNFELEVAQGRMTGRQDGMVIFVCTPAGVRVVTTLDGGIVGVVGIAATSVSISLTSGGMGAEKYSAALHLKVQPNDEWSIVMRPHSTPNATLVRHAPFMMPFS